MLGVLYIAFILTLYDDKIASFPYEFLGNRENASFLWATGRRGRMRWVGEAEKGQDALYECVSKMETDETVFNQCQISRYAGCEQTAPGLINNSARGKGKN